MSVHQESLEIKKPADDVEGAPELEYRAVSHDSLSMFLAAIGGAVLGMLLTLLILALINGGTLSFSGGERLTTFEATLDRVNENVGAVSTNVDLVSQQAQAVAAQLTDVEAALRAEIANQGDEVASLNTAVEQLDVTRQQFDLFMSALGSVMGQMQEIAAPEAATSASPAAPAATAAAPAEPAPAQASVATPNILTSADVPADALDVVLFVDANGNGALDSGESQVDGVEVVLTSADGETSATENSIEGGIRFSDLAAGDYQVTAGDASAEVTVNPAETEGQILYIPVAQ